MKNRVLHMLAIILILSGCLGSKEKSEEKKVEGFHGYQTDELRILIPDEWEVLKPIHFKSDTPQNALIAFRSNVRNPKFTGNVAIVRNELSEEIGSLEYGKALRQKTLEDLIEGKEIIAEQRKIMLRGKENDTIYFVVEGKEAPQSDLKRFFQISGVQGMQAYIAIGSVLSEESEGMTKTMETMVKSFEVK